MVVRKVVAMVRLVAGILAMVVREDVVNVVMKEVVVVRERVAIMVARGKNTEHGNDRSTDMVLRVAVVVREAEMHGGKRSSGGNGGEDRSRGAGGVDGGSSCDEELGDEVGRSNGVLDRDKTSLSSAQNAILTQLYIICSRQVTTSEIPVFNKVSFYNNRQIY